MLIPLNELDFSLRELGLIRIHVPRNPTSFYRCFADRLLASQLRHAQLRRHLIRFARSREEWQSLLPALEDEEAPATQDMAFLVSACFGVPVILFHQQPPFQLTHTVYETKTGDSKEDASCLPVCVAAYEVEGVAQYDMVWTQEQVRVAALTQSEYPSSCEQQPQSDA